MRKKKFLPFVIPNVSSLPPASIVTDYCPMSTSFFLFQKTKTIVCDQTVLPDCLIVDKTKLGENNAEIGKLSV